MSIKETLLQEAQNIKTDVELDSIFESIELSDDVKTKFSAVFESTVKANAVKLAESHVAQMAEMADQLVEEKATEKNAQLAENVNKYFEHLVEEWMTENKLAVENGIKVQMFESLLGAMKTTFVEHNVLVPDEAVDVVTELQGELEESKVELNKVLDSNLVLKESIKTMKRDQEINEAVAGLTDIQKEKVIALSEGISYSESFGTKLSAIVEMVSVTKPTKQEPIAEGLNFVPPENEPVQQPVVEQAQPAIDPEVMQYLNL